MLTELTEAQELIVAEFAEEWLGVLDTCKQPDLKSKPILDGLTLLYSLYDKPLPSRIELASPEAALDLSRSLGEKNPHFDLTASWYAGWDAWRLAFVRLGVLTNEEAADLITYSGLFLNGVYDTVLLDDCAIVIPFPKLLHRDDSDELHCATGPAIAWENEEFYYWHGLETDERHITGKWNKKQILAEVNTEQRRILQERLGQEFYRLIGSKVIDSWVDPETSLAYELLSYDDNGPARAIRKTSPLLKNGKQPVYCERVNVLCASAQSARKWQATRHLHATSDTAAIACNSNPELSYGLES